MAKLCREGGVELINFLLSAAVPQSDETRPSQNVREWTYKDIARLPQLERQEWESTCREELEVTACAERVCDSLIRERECVCLLRSHIVDDCQPMLIHGYLQGIYTVLPWLCYPVPINIIQSSPFLSLFLVPKGFLCPQFLQHLLSAFCRSYLILIYLDLS